MFQLSRKVHQNSVVCIARLGISFTVCSSGRSCPNVLKKKIYPAAAGVIASPGMSNYLEPKGFA